MSKVILVTGSSRGIGKAIAELAHKNGYTVIVHGKTDSAKLNELNKKLSGSKKLVFDVASKEATSSAIKSLDVVVDVLINNAGVALNFINDLQESDDEKALTEYKVNILGIIHCTQSVLPGMLKKGKGSVINIASIKGRSQLTTLSSLTYGSTKAGVIAITKALAKVYSPYGVRFNVVSPGYVETDQASTWNKETFKRIGEGTIFGRMAKPEEIAKSVLFLASDDSSYTTGSELLVDGGYAIKGK